MIKGKVCWKRNGWIRQIQSIFWLNIKNFKVKFSGKSTTTYSWKCWIHFILKNPDVWTWNHTEVLKKAPLDSNIDPLCQDPGGRGSSSWLSTSPSSCFLSIQATTTTSFSRPDTDGMSPISQITSLPNGCAGKTGVLFRRFSGQYQTSAGQCIFSVFPWVFFQKAWVIFVKSLNFS